MAKLFFDAEDYRSAQKVASMFGASARDASLKESAKKLYDDMKKPKEPKKEKNKKGDKNDKNDTENKEDNKGDKDNKDSKK